MRSSIVGQRSHRRPGRSFTSAPETISGTGLVVWAVSGLPSGFMMRSALPWSAVMRITPPIFFTASTICPTHASTVSTAWIAAALTPV